MCFRLLIKKNKSKIEKSKIEQIYIENDFVVDYLPSYIEVYPN